MVLLVAVAGAGYLAVRTHLERGVVEFGSQAKVVAHELTTTTDSVSTSGVDQRYRVRRDAVASMHADLLRLVRAESMFIADSGYPRSTFLPGSPYDVRTTRGNLWYGFSFGDTAMTSTASNTTVTGIRCSISVPYHLDTTARPPRFVLSPAPVEPVCTAK